MKIDIKKRKTIVEITVIDNSILINYYSVA